MKQCKIIIRDEVNCKIEGLEANDRRKLVTMLEFEVPGARYLPSVKLGRWDGKVSYFSLAGSTYINLLDQIIPYLDQNGYSIELQDNRKHTIDFQFDKIEENTFSHITWPSGHAIAGQPIMLRDYQVKLVNSFLTNPQSIQVAATGSGKTICCAALSYSVQKYGRSIVIVPNKSLVTQTEADYRNIGLDVGVYFGDRKETGHLHTICTWQSILNLIKNSSEDQLFTITDFLRDVICVICDEVHTVKADSLKSMLSGVMSDIPLRFGLTGTIPKDKFASTALLVCIGAVTDTLAASDLQDIGVLANCHINIVQLQDDVSFRDYKTELKYLLENSERLDALANLINKIKNTGNTLVLVDRVAAGEELMSRLPDSVFIRGTTKLTERKEEYDDLANIDNKVIIATYGVASTGISINRIFNLVLIEAGKSFTRIIQSCGRSLRVASDKTHAEIYDITSNCKFSKRHLTQRKSYYTEVKYPYSTEKLFYK